jgi:predicted enzyme related to lactoylglutathione lyase
MEFATGQPCWMDVTVKDVESRDGLMDFLAGVFGWTFEIGGPETGHYTMAFSDGDRVAALMADPDGYGQFLTYFAVPDIESTSVLAAELGANVFMGPMQVMDAGSMSIGVDPTGAAFGLWQKDQFDGFDAYDRPNAPCWFDHQSSAPAAAGTFYSALLGLVAQTVDDDGSAMLSTGAEPFASVSPEFGGAPPHWTPLITVSSVDESLAKAVALDATVLVSGLPVPGGIAAAFTAPVTGTVITIVELTDVPD